MKKLQHFDALMRLQCHIKLLSAKYRKPRLFFWLQALFCHLVYGVTPNQYIGFRFHKLNHLERRTFYTARHQARYDRQLNPPNIRSVFWNKQKFNIVFKDYIQRHWLYTPTATTEQIDAFLQAHPKVLVKPLASSSGKGIHVYSNESIESLQKTPFLLEEFIDQHPDMSHLNASSVNTVRIYTMLDKMQNPHILSVILRVGGMNSSVDNYHAGGVAYPVDIESGIVSQAGRTIDGNTYLFHPGTDAKVVGFSIPNYSQCIQFVMSAAKVLPQARLIAWDIAITETGFEMIEGNCEGDSGVMQTPSGRGVWPEILAQI